MSLRVTLHPDAETELRGARIRRWPDAAPLVPDLHAELAVRRAPLHAFPYHLAYIVEHGFIHVLAIAHDNRRPNYWRDRTE